MKAHIIKTTSYPAQTVADRLFSHGFTPAELQILSRNLIFKEAVNRMQTIDDAFALTDLGSTLIKEMVKRGEWAESLTEYPHTIQTSTANSHPEERP